MIYFPFDNASSTNLDRNVSSDVYADYMAMFFRNGVHITEDSSYFQVYSEEVVDQMTVQVKVGLGLINGRFAHEDTERTLIIQASEAQDRIDAVVLRLDLSLREIDLYVVKGTAGSSPIAPTPTRAGDVYELVLAHVYINATSTTITNDKITDTRLNSDLCGVIAGTIDEIDTTDIFDQYQAALDAYLAIVAAAIDETLYGQLVDLINLKQDILVSGTNIKTINGESVLGSGDLDTLTSKTLTAPTISGLMTLNGGQIKFPATQNPSSDANTLDDYEEGTWTPTVSGDSGVSGQTYSIRYGHYTKIGNVVHCSINIILSNKGTLSGNACGIIGLPFTHLSNSVLSASVDFVNLSATLAFLTLSGTSSGFVYFRYGSASNTGINYLSSASISNTTQIKAQLTYLTAN